MNFSPHLMRWAQNTAALRTRVQCSGVWVTTSVHTVSLRNGDFLSDRWPNQGRNVVLPGEDTPALVHLTSCPLKTSHLCHWDGGGGRQAGHWSRASTSDFSDPGTLRLHCVLHYFLWKAEWWWWIMTVQETYSVRRISESGSPNTPQIHLLALPEKYQWSIQVICYLWVILK